MSEQQLADLEAEKALMTPEQLADEKMLMAYEIRFWRQRAWRAEQQRDRANAERKAAEMKYEKFKDLPQESLDTLLNKIKEEKVVALKDQASKLIGYIPWTKYELEEKSMKDTDAKIDFWSKLISYYNTMEHEDT